MNADLRNKIDRLSMPEPNTGCWLWPGSLNSGYGSISVGNKKHLAHRVSYAEYVGDPVGQIVMHKCDTPACVNPDHLVLGSPKDNAIDAARKLRTGYARASQAQRQAWAQQPSTSGLKASTGLSLSERVERMSIPEPNTGCHLWMGATGEGGYGKIKVNGSMRRAHRVSYAANIGEIPSGMFVCHKCDTPACVNPDHLFSGDARDNMMDAMKKGRAFMARVSADQRAEWTKERLAQEEENPEIRRDIQRRGWVTRHKNGRACTLTYEQCVKRTGKSWEARRAKYGDLGRSGPGKYSRDASKKGWAGMTPEAHAERVKKIKEGVRKSREAKSHRLVRINFLRAA